MLYGLVDYELLNRTPEYEEVGEAAAKSRYLQLQKTRFAREPVEFPVELRPTQVLGVDYVYGKAESTGGRLGGRARTPSCSLISFPEKWRFRQVKLSHRRQTYYVQSKDRIHLVWEVSRLGELLEDTADRRDATRRSFSTASTAPSRNLLLLWN